MLGLFDWLFGTKPMQSVVQAVNNTVITEPDGVYDGYVIVKGERISLDGVNPPVITLLKILMRDWKKVKMVDHKSKGPMYFFGVTFEDIVAEICYIPYIHRESVWDIGDNSLDVNFTFYESKVLCSVYRKLAKDRSAKFLHLNKIRKDRSQNKQRLEIDKMLREKYNV